MSEPAQPDPYPKPWHEYDGRPTRVLVLEAVGTLLALVGIGAGFAAAGSLGGSEFAC